LYCIVLYCIVLYCIGPKSSFFLINSVIIWMGSFFNFIEKLYIY